MIVAIGQNIAEGGMSTGTLGFGTHLLDQMLTLQSQVSHKRQVCRFTPLQDLRHKELLIYMSNRVAFTTRKFAQIDACNQSKYSSISICYDITYSSQMRPTYMGALLVLKVGCNSHL